MVTLDVSALEPLSEEQLHLCLVYLVIQDMPTEHLQNVVILQGTVISGRLFLLDGQFIQQTVDLQHQVGGHVEYGQVDLDVVIIGHLIYI